MISRTISAIYELDDGTNEKPRFLSKSLAEKMAMKTGAKINEMSDVRVAISDDDFINAASFKVLPAVKGKDEEAEIENV